MNQLTNNNNNTNFIIPMAQNSLIYDLTRFTNL